MSTYVQMYSREYLDLVQYGLFVWGLYEEKRDIMMVVTEILYTTIDNITQKCAAMCF